MSVTLSVGAGCAFSAEQHLYIFCADQGAGLVTPKHCAQESGVDSERKLQAITIMTIYKENELERTPCPKISTD